MYNIGKLILDGFLFSCISSFLLIIGFHINPRIFLQDYPKDIQAKVPEKTLSERRQSLLIGIPFILVLILFPFFSTLGLKQQNSEGSSFIALFINAFGVAFFFNLVDWLLLDWLIFCTITPKFVIIPGTEGMASYKDYRFHFRGFLIGTLLTVVAALLISGIVFFIG